MESVIVRLKKYRSAASDTEQGVIRYILNHMDEAAQINIRELARRSFVSAATVTRLCKKTGFANYRDYQSQLVCELALKKRIGVQNDFEVRREDDLGTLVMKEFSRSRAALEDTQKLLDLRVLASCVDLLERAKSVTFFGVGASLLVAKDAYMKFIRIKKTCQVYEDQDVQLVLAKTMRSEDLAVLISYSGRTEAIVTFAKILRENAVPVIAITGFVESPLSKIADYNLYVSAAEYEFKSGKLTSRITQLAVIDLLYLAYLQRTYEGSADALQNTYLAKTGGTNESEKFNRTDYGDEESGDHEP